MTALFAGATAAPGAAHAALASAGTVIPNFARGSDCVLHNRTFCWTWFQDHFSDTFMPALGQHIVLTVIAVVIGFALSMLAALVAYRRRWFERPFTLVSGILYTIPSVALFQLLVPITGITRLTVEIALVSYTLLIIFRNVLVGLREVPDEVREAARGMGLTPRQTLLRIELPLAIPAIVGGLRVATVTVISLATIAAFIIDQGLGAPIFAAIRTDFHTELIGAGALAVALALVADVLFVSAQRLLTPWASTRRA